ncbi:MAG: SsrA-binding protein SmpB [Mollicutes bacterium]|nr:SsrA-binding protein SmpB [Mollicutes bacterium]MDD7264260.1 SsrA-binding protein SmpB [bacterium]MDY4980083.1 SsrA-binding protein SmpB [Candidatus Onthovivens sp.]
MENKDSIKILVSNKKAHFNYFLSDFLECGIELFGTEIKSIKNHGCSINDAYCVIKNNEMFIINMNIAPYEKGTVYNHDPLRNRRLLLHKNEILKFNNRVTKDGYTIIPTKIYLKKGMCKVEIALGKGKKLYDKRETIKQRDDERNMAKAIKRT